MSSIVRFASQDFVLDASGALYWPSQKAVILSDVHLGKVAHFRKHGAALPTGAQYENYLRLTKLIERYKPQHMLIIGDLFHSTINSEWPVFEDFVRTQQTKFSLIVGNHDIIDPKRFLALSIEVLDVLTLHGITFSHYPDHESEVYRISGHLHPAIRLSIGAAEKRTLKCFYIKNNQFVLPSFGYFTGNTRIKQLEVDQVYVIAEGEVIAI
jgi:DNA ligase-associated metallophosphoesterase